MDTASASRLPFDPAHLDRLLDEAGIDILLVTSKHNIQYLTGGHRFFFHDYADAIGVLSLHSTQLSRSGLFMLLNARLELGIILKPISHASKHSFSLSLCCVCIA
jgi:Creatinase/Prolidase N-terminal domain